MTKDTIPTNKDDLPLVLDPRHIQILLNMGRRQTYEFLKDPPFHIERMGGRGIIKVSKETFFNWLEGKEQG